MTTVADAERTDVHALVTTTEVRSIRIALLGVGQVGSAVAALVADPRLEGRFMISKGLVRDVFRERPLTRHLHLTSSVERALDDGPDIVIEALGGLEPARTLVREALERRIPVVTANKSLLAAHGEELLDLAAREGVPLRYEAAVLAGVPFLDTFARRGLARQISSLSGIVNGTTNFILSKMAAERWTFAAALADAQRRGYAEPDPANDIEGVDAAEKLCVLVRHFGDWRVQTSEIETEGISRIEEHDIRAAAGLNGSIKPIVYADWSTGTLTAFCGPAFVPSTHPLARVNDVQNAVVLRNRMVGDLFFAGPGAGPAVTAATLLDDAAEIAASGVVDRRVRAWRRADPTTPATDWFIRIAGERLPESGTIADLLSTYGVELRATVEGRCGGREQRWHLTRPCGRARVAAASTALSAAANCDSRFIRALAG